MGQCRIHRKTNNTSYLTVKEARKARNYIVLNFPGGILTVTFQKSISSYYHSIIVRPTI